jgi:copper chaperone CopZ
MSHYFHVVPGRLRIKSPFIKEKNSVGEVEGLLATIHGIKSFDINTVTGSILINYNPKVVTSEKIISVFKKAGYFDPSKAITNDHYIHTAVSSISHTIFSFLTVLI